MKPSRFGFAAAWLCTLALAALANAAEAAPTISLSASPTTITSGATSKLTWSVRNARWCYATGAWSGTKALSGTQNVAPTATATYGLTCRGYGSSTSASTTVTVSAGAAPVISFTASPTTIDAGATSTLTWNVRNARWCTGSGAWSGDKGLSGTERVTPAATSTYTLYCRGDSSKSASNTITVRSAGSTPTATLTASPTSIQRGGSSTLTWNSTNATSCTGSGGWSGSLGTSGSRAVSPSETTSYTLTCSGTGGSIARTAQVSVSAGGGDTSANIFVSPTGSDSAAGTSSAPYKTIQKAASVARAGDVVSVAAGSYAGFQVNSSGTSSSRIVFRANGTVSISQASTGYGIYLNNASYVTIEGFSISGTSSKGIAARGATPTSPMRGVQILRNTITNTREEGLYLSELESSLVEGNTVTNVGTGGVTETGHGMYLANAGSDNTVVRGNTFDSPNNSWGEAMHINGDESVGGDGLIKNLLIENNRIGGFNNGMSLDGVQSSVIRNNIIIDTHHHGIRGYQIDGASGPSGLVIVNNTIRAPEGNAVKTTEDAGSSVVFNNILVGGDGATSFGVSASTGANLTTFAATAPSYAPTTAAIGTGLTSLAGKTAPTTDANGRARHSPPDIGAVEH